MTAHHFFVTPSDVQDGVVTIAGDEARHAARVLRVRPGEAITVADNTGRVIDAVVSSVGDTVTADVKSEVHHLRPRPVVTLVQALSKGDKLDVVVEKTSEAGVARIVPFVAERSVVRWDDRKRARAVERWRQIALAAAKQSRAPWITELDDVADDARCVGRAPEPRVVLHEAASARLREVLPDAAPDDITLVVGPEGGLSDGEIDELSSGGADVVSLGPRIYRTETAGLVAASVIGYVYGHVG